MMYTSRRPSPFCLSTYAALTLLVPAMVLLRGEPETAPRSRAPIVCASPEVSARVAREPAVSSTPARERVIEGLWQRYDGVADGDPMRFYYFHDGAHGLYRYGKVGYTNTHGFNYAADGSSLTLRFRKSGERHEVTYRVEREGGRDWLVLEDDPREPGATRYFRVARGGQAPARADAAGGELGGAAIGGRLWGDERRFATGGMGFAIYQLQAQSIDGRGVGWFHRGDYDEWTTEALSYRQQGDSMVITFSVRREEAVTPIAVRELEGDDGEPQRELTIESDPRDFWRAHSYRDMGPTFAAKGFDAVVDWDPSFAVRR